MAIPKAYQVQMHADGVMQKDRKVGARKRNSSLRISSASEVVSKNDLHKLINLNKKRKYLRIGLICLIIYCLSKCINIITKWETNAYNLGTLGDSFSAGKKAEVSLLNQPQEMSTGTKPIGDVMKLVPDALTDGAVSNKTPVFSDAAASSGTPSKSSEAMNLPAGEVRSNPLSTSSPKEAELLLKLAAQRQDIEKREERLKEREMAVLVTEKKQKDEISELTKLKKTIEELLKKTDKASQKKSASLVKIYEGMTPENAAHVFERIDTVILKELIPLMSQRKVSRILDRMSVVKARELSLLLISDKNPFAALAPKQ